MIPSVAFGLPDERAVFEEGRVVVDADPRPAGLGEELADAAVERCGIEVEIGLDTVLGLKINGRAVGRPGDAGDEEVFRAVVGCVDEFYRVDEAGRRDATP